MSVYNHRPMIPTAQSRISDFLDNIKAEFDSLNQEASVFKMQRDDLEHKMTTQIQEMSAFQQNLFELERTQLGIKKQYEDEIIRLRQQLEQARAGHPPTPGSSSSAPSGAGHPSQAHQPIPPNLGHGPSNLFGSIINSAQGGPQGPGLVAPPQMVDPSQQPNQHSGYPSGPNGPPPQPPNAAGGPGAPPGTPYINGNGSSGGGGGGGAPPSSGSQQQGSQGAQGHLNKRMRTDVDGPGAQPSAQGQPGGPQGMYGGAPSGGGIPTPPAPGGQNNPGQPGPMMGQPGQPGTGEWANGGYYPSRGGVAPGTPTSQPANLPPVDASGQQSSSGSSGSNKRKSAGPGGLPAGTPPASSILGGAGRSSSIGKQQGGQPGAAGAVVPAGAGGMQIGLSDMDPETVPANLKTEGSDWFAIFNPKVQRQLKVDLIHTLDHQSVVCCVKFSADGKYLAAGCNRSTHIYETSTAAKICILQDENVGKEGDLYIRSVCFSPDGKFLATGAEDKQIRIWDIQKKRIRQFFTGHEQDIYSLDFSRDGRIIASGSGDRTARIWDMETSKCLHILRISDQDPKDPGVTSVAISPDGRLVAAGSLDKMVRIWDTSTGYLMERLEGHKDSVYSVAFMPDGNTLVSGSLDKTLKLWQLGTSEGRGGPVERDRSRAPCKTTFQGHRDFVLSVACTPCGNWVVSGSKDRGVMFWDPRTGQTQFMLQGHKNSVISVALSPTGRTLFATGSGDNRARIWSYEAMGPQ